MSTTRTVSRSMTALSRGPLQCLRKAPTISSIIQKRAASHATIPWHLLPCPFAVPGARNNTKRQCELRQLSRSSAARRTFSATSAAGHGDWSPPKAGEELYVTFIDKDGEETKIAVSKGDNLLDIAQANDIEMEGACGGSCACSTCHVIVEDEELYDQMPEPDDDENDMLDLAFGLTETSRLGCQVVMDESLDGMRVKLPSMTRNLQASDFSKRMRGRIDGGNKQTLQMRFSTTYVASIYWKRSGSTGCGTPWRVSLMYNIMWP